MIIYKKMSEGEELIRQVKESIKDCSSEKDIRDKIPFQ